MIKISNNNNLEGQRISPQKVKSICPDCGNNSIVKDYQRGDIICRECGTVISETMIDDGPEWRAFTTKERNNRSRVGSPTNYTVHDKGLSTNIGFEDRDSYGRKLSHQKKSEMNRLRKWNVRSRMHSSADRNLVKAFGELSRLVSQLGLPRSVEETASVIYRKALHDKLIRGRTIDTMIAASAYAAARQRRIPRTLDEISSHSRISKKELGRSYRLLVNELNLKIPLADPNDYISRFSADLKLKGSTASRAREIVMEAKKKGLTGGKAPTGIAAAALYISSIIVGERRTQQEIAETATVTEVTIRNRYKELVKKLELSNPKN